MGITSKLNPNNEYNNLVAEAKNTKFPTLAKLQYVICIICIFGMLLEGANIYISLLAGINLTSAFYIQLNSKLNNVIKLIEHTQNKQINKDTQ